MKNGDISAYNAVEKLRDHRSVTIRAIRPEDKSLLREAFKGLDEYTIRLRFFGMKKELTDQELVQATEIDFDRNVALVSCVQEAQGERIIGVGRYITLERPSQPCTAEIAFLVEEDFHGQGIASSLLKHLVTIGRLRGVLRFEAEVLPANGAMLRVFERSGLSVETNASSDYIHVTLSLNEGEIL